MGGWVGGVGGVWVACQGHQRLTSGVEPVNGNTAMLNTGHPVNDHALKIGHTPLSGQSLEKTPTPDKNDHGGRFSGP